MLSLQKIRELNQLYLHVACCSDPAGRISVDGPTSGAMDQGAGVWSFGMYADGGTRLNAAIKGTSSSLDKSSAVLETALGKFGAMALREAWGVIPQIDYSRKFIFNGSDTVNLDFTCYLVLEEDVVRDFFDPLIRLFFLTYPRRTTATLPDLAAQGVSSLSQALDRGAAKFKSLSSTWETSGRSVLASGADVASYIVSGLGLGAEAFASFLSGVSDFVEDWAGEIYGMIAPPTFMSKVSGKLGVSSAVLPNGVKLTYYPDKQLISSVPQALLCWRVSAVSGCKHKFQDHACRHCGYAVLGDHGSDNEWVVYDYRGGTQYLWDPHLRYE